jgi:hypothetical protein
VFIILSPYTKFLNMKPCGEFKKNRRIQIKNGNLSNPETVNTVHIWLSVTGGNVEWCSVSSTRHYFSLGDSGKDKRQFTPAISVICNANKLRDCSDSDVDRNVWLSCLFYSSHGTVMLWQTETKTSDELWGETELWCFFLLEKIDVQLTPRSTVLLEKLTVLRLVKNFLNFTKR